MKNVVMIITRSLAVLVPIALGMLVMIFSGALKSTPETRERTPPATPVRVITLSPIQILPRVVGYGTVAPAREWRAVARVDGEVIETSPLLANGELVPAGTVLLKLNDTDLRLSLAQIDAQMGALDVKDRTLKASLVISKSDLTLSEADLERQKTLRDQGVATQASLDQAERTVLGARAKVTENENQLALNDSERKVLAAQRAIAERNLDFATITAPYDLRIGEVSAELGQVVTRGAVLLVAEGTEAAEITAQFQMGLMRPLLRMLGKSASARELSARVILPLPGQDVTWDAEVKRSTEAIDARTQAVNIVVGVDNPQGQAQAGVRPPLRRNMFVKVELSAPERKALVVPADAVHDYLVLVVTADNKLEPRTVSVAYRVENVAVISDGLAAGDRLVVTDPSVAVPGMTVTPIEDTELKLQIARVANDGVPVK